MSYEEEDACMAQPVKKTQRVPHSPSLSLSLLSLSLTLSLSLSLSFSDSPLSRARFLSAPLPLSPRDTETLRG
jgi:hypothetical protein